MPSGILCNVIAIAIFIPKLKSLPLVKKVIIPSGTLCNTNTIALIIPNLYKLLPFSSRLFTNLFDILISNTPITKEIIDTNKPKYLYLKNKEKKEAGIKSNMLIRIITIALKLKLILKNLFIFLTLININIQPKSVDKPAIVLIKKAYTKLFIISLIKYMHKYKNN